MEDQATTYKVDDIFQDIKGDDENVLMTIPPEVSERMGWLPGDNLKITVEDGRIEIVKIEEQKDINGEK
jgi:AbrB family looped-hinge helix DNA binding protein|tara:strand:+ start:738 stop:944 length:207 start_codon:yes stop_codon:yes gene_type:complete